MQLTPADEARKAFAAQLKAGGGGLSAQAMRDQYAKQQAGASDGGGDGLLGTLLAIPGHLVSDAKDLATGIVPGIIETGKAVGKDFGALAHGDASFTNSERIALAVLKGFAEDFKHPLRHPLNTILDVWGLGSAAAGTAARLGNASRAAAAGENALKAFAVVKPEARAIRLHDSPDLVAGTYSKNALTRQIQKRADVLREQHPDARIGLRTQTQRYGAALRKKNYEFPQQLERAAANELKSLEKQFSTPELTAMRVFAENTPIDQRIAYHDKLIADLSKLDQRNTRRATTLLESAKAYVTTGPDGQVEWLPGTEKLQDAYRKMEDLVNRREQAYVDAGLMTPEGVVSRRSATAKLVAGGKFIPSEAAAKTARFLDGRLAMNDTAASAARELVAKAVTASRAPSGAKAASVKAGERIAQLTRRIDKTFDPAAHSEDVRALNRHFNNTRKLFDALRDKTVHDARIAIAREKDAAKRAVLADEAAREIARLRDAQQAVIVLHKKFLKDGFNRIIGGDGANEGRVFVPFMNTRSAAAVYKIAGLGSRGVVGVPKNQFLRPLRGRLLAKGGGRYDVLSMNAERTHEAVRFIYLVKFRHELIALAKDSPVGMRNPVALKMDSLRNKSLNAGVRQILDKVENNVKLNKNERTVLGDAYDEIRDEFFDAKKSKALDMESFVPEPGVKWIEKDMLGGLDEPSPLVGLDKGAGRIVLKSLDEINNLSKFITLYLRPATLVPNILSGVALNLIQQGFFAPSNLARAYALHWKMRPAARKVLDQVMGEGRAGVLRSSGGIGAAAVNKAAGVFGMVQDLPFRRAAFLHEARREGYRTLKDIDRLVTDPELRDVLFRVKERANAAIIDYSNLGRFERDLLRRAFYFYPWLKGATVYTGRFVSENPVQAAVAGQVGQVGTQVSNEQFGMLPSWARGLYQVGSRDGNPLSVNAGSVLPFGTAADLGGTALGLVQGQTDASSRVTANLSPVASALLAALTNRSGLGAPLPQRGFAEQFARQLWDNTTPGALTRRLTTDQTGKPFPVTTRDALLGYIFGNATYGRPTDVSVLNSLAEKEKAGV